MYSCLYTAEKPVPSCNKSCHFCHLSSMPTQKNAMPHLFYSSLSKPNICSNTKPPNESHALFYFNFKRYNSHKLCLHLLSSNIS